MVLEGQFLERATLIDAGDRVLEGLYHRGRLAPPVVVCAPHPALGGSMDAPPVAELAWALTRAGHATLRFNYAGVGASQGAPRWRASERPAHLTADALAGELADLRAAIASILETTRGNRLVVAGYSFGAAVALAAQGWDDVEALLLVAPPTALADLSALANVTKPALVLLAEHDALCDRAAVSALAASAPRARVEVVPGADHFFGSGLAELGKRAVAWLGTL